MSITDKLRDYVESCDGCDIPMSPTVLLGYCDRIDEEHEKAVDAFERDMGMEPMTDENMAKHGWVRLADGAVGPRMREVMDQIVRMSNMTISEKISFLMLRNQELRAENEKLRKLAIGLWWCTEENNRVQCTHCPLGEDPDSRLNLTCERIMKELGIEVD